MFTFRDRPANGLFVGTIALVVLGEVYLVVRFEFYRAVTLPLLILSLYVPLTFFFFCNVFHVRRERELIWAGVFCALCGLSVLLTGTLHLTAVIPLCLALSAWFCYLETRRPPAP
ncbi:MAG TPA: hypothetical protein EYP85_09085 [Armatimonadetes bacterium]|nr:hypothetical protein [Armatimonadota bacterium]